MHLNVAHRETRVGRGQTIGRNVLTGGRLEADHEIDARYAFRQREKARLIDQANRFGDQYCDSQACQFVRVEVPVGQTRLQ